MDVDKTLVNKLLVVFLVLVAFGSGYATHGYVSPPVAVSIAGVDGALVDEAKAFTRSCVESQQGIHREVHPATRQASAWTPECVINALNILHFLAAAEGYNLTPEE